MVGLNTRMSSRYIVMQRIRSENVKFINLWKVAGALHRPMGITKYSNNPYGVKNAVLDSSPSRMRTWWYAWLRSIELNTVALPRRSNKSATRGIGNTSSLVYLFKLR